MDRSDPPGEGQRIVAGQVWRLRAVCPSGRALTGVVVTAGLDLLVAPVTCDPPAHTDPWTVHLATGTGTVVAVWVSLAQPVSREALAVHVDDVDAGPSRRYTWRCAAAWRDPPTSASGGL